MANNYLRPDLLSEIARLREENEALRAEVAILQGELTVPEHDLGRQLRIPPRLLFLLYRLVNHPFVAKEAIEAHYRTGTYGRLCLHQLRIHLAPLDIPIHNMHGQGYYLESSDRSYLKSLLKEKPSEADQSPVR